jgi:hypothetical protein
VEWCAVVVFVSVDGLHDIGWPAADDGWLFDDWGRDFVDVHGCGV